MGEVPHPRRARPTGRDARGARKWREAKLGGGSMKLNEARHGLGEEHAMGSAAF